jgi:hypothetical protein
VEELKRQQLESGPSQSFVLDDEKQPQIRSSMPFFTLLRSGILLLSGEKWKTIENTDLA